MWGGGTSEQGKRVINRGSEANSPLRGAGQNVSGFPIAREYEPFVLFQNLMSIFSPQIAWGFPHKEGEAALRASPLILQHQSSKIPKKKKIIISCVTFTPTSPF